MLLATYGRSSGFCIDPIEKKPLNHFYPGTVQAVVALERVVDAEALREIAPRAQLVGEVAHQLQQRGPQIAFDGHG
ncbi:MAG TPA: hypothetical protein VLJ62_13270 [Burkholderiaceae bacterium]|nr:hypothetical protein [Burkholderiaceae bacterium]